MRQLLVVFFLNLAVLIGYDLLLLRCVLPGSGLLPELGCCRRLRLRARARSRAISSFHGYVWLCVFMFGTLLLFWPVLDGLRHVLITALPPQLWALNEVVPPLVLGNLLFYWMFRDRIRRSLRAQLLAAVLCVRCGYDLRGSSGRCPECGGSGPRVP